MSRMRWTRTTLGGVFVAGVVLAGVTTGLAVAQGTATGHVVSTCDNPTLNKDLAGWGALSGAAPGGPFRYPLFGTAGEHVDAAAAYVTANNTQPNPRAWLPQDPARPGAEKTYSVDARTDMQGRARVEVDWYAANNAFLGHTDGPWTDLAGGQPFTWKTLAGDFTPPTNAARANVLAGAELPAGADFSLTGCSYLPAGSNEEPPPTTEEPPPSSTEEPPPTTEEPPSSTEEPPPSTEEPPPGDQTEAAVKYNWGTPIAAGSDEFNYTGAPDPAKWGVYGEGGCWPGHAGNGQRCADRNNVDGSKLVQTGLANGDSAGIASNFNQQYGRWEARVRSVGNGGGNPYHPLLIIWPQSEQWPDDGEYDFLENGAPGMQCAEAFLHYPGHTPKVQEHAQETNCGAPLSEWHNVALEWTPEDLVGYIDGKEWFRFGDYDMTAMPSGHLTIQLDNFYGGGMQPANYEVDWVRTYAP